MEASRHPFHLASLRKFWRLHNSSRVFGEFPSPAQCSPPLACRRIHRVVEEEPGVAAAMWGTNSRRRASALPRHITMTRDCKRACLCQVGILPSSSTCPTIRRALPGSRNPGVHPEPLEGTGCIASDWRLPEA